MSVFCCLQHCIAQQYGLSVCFSISVFLVPKEGQETSQRGKDIHEAAESGDKAALSRLLSDATVADCNYQEEVCISVLCGGLCIKYLVTMYGVYVSNPCILSCYRMGTLH